MATVHCSIAEGSSSLSFSRAAIEETKIAGCDMTVESSSSFGPSLHFANKSYPKMMDALSKRAFAAGISLHRPTAMPTACAPCPGNMKPTLYDTGAASAIMVALNRAVVARGRYDRDRDVSLDRIVAAVVTDDRIAPHCITITINMRALMDTREKSIIDFNAIQIMEKKVPSREQPVAKL